MQRWVGPLEVPDAWGRSVVTIGVFDGVHRGHQLIVARAVQAAAELGLPVVVVTFDPHPDEVVRPGTHPPLLCTARREWQLLASLGVTPSCVIPFTLEFSRLGPDEFVRAVLVDRLHAARVVVGENFRFGHKAAGDVELLAELGEKYDFSCRGRAAADRERRHRLLDRHPRHAGRRETSPGPRTTSAGHTGWRESSSAGTSGGVRSGSRRPTWRRSRTQRSRPTASTRAG